jgi:hypothetical protein
MFPQNWWMAALSFVPAPPVIEPACGRHPVPHRVVRTDGNLSGGFSFLPLTRMLVAVGRRRLYARMDLAPNSPGSRASG